MTWLRSGQSVLALVACCVAASEFIHLFAIKQGTTKFPASTILFYIVFFGIMGIYARLIGPIKPVLSIAKSASRVILLFALGVAVIFFCLSFASAQDERVVQRFGSLHAVLAFLYMAIGIVLINGDAFIEPLARWLKFGRTASTRELD